MPREIHWTDAEEIGIQLQEKFPETDPLTVRFTDLHRLVTELPGFADDPAKSNEPKVRSFPCSLRFGTYAHPWKTYQPNAIFL